MPAGAGQRDRRIPVEASFAKDRADERPGSPEAAAAGDDDRLELIETLQAYFEAGDNVTATARRLHLATWTVTYRLEKIESLLSHPIDGEV